MHRVLFAVGKLAIATFALSPVQSHANALQCQIFEWRCNGLMPGLQSSPSHFGVPIVKVRTIRVEPDAEDI